jgi:hypothetical protein
MASVRFLITTEDEVVFPLEVSSTTTIRQVKQLVENSVRLIVLLFFEDVLLTHVLHLKYNEQIGMPVAQQALVHHGKQLRDTDTVGLSQIQNDDVVLVVESSALAHAPAPASAPAPTPAPAGGPISADIFQRLVINLKLQLGM